MALVQCLAHKTLKESSRKKPGKRLCIIIVKCLVQTADKLLGVLNILCAASVPL